MGAREEQEEDLVREVGRSIGYGRTMQLCEQLWREDLVAIHHLPPGGELSTGPCAALMVPCPCPENGRDANGHCDWCCGAKHVTKRVLEAITEQQEMPRVPRLTDADLGTEREVERMEAALRWIGANCEDPEMVRHNISRALRGKSVP
jgi:hypothetical protein